MGEHVDWEHLRVVMPYDIGVLALVSRQVFAESVSLCSTAFFSLNTFTAVHYSLLERFLEALEESERRLIISVVVVYPGWSKTHEFPVLADCGCTSLKRLHVALKNGELCSSRGLKKCTHDVQTAETWQTRYVQKKYQDQYPHCEVSIEETPWCQSEACPACGLETFSKSESFTFAMQ